MADAIAAEMQMPPSGEQLPVPTSPALLDLPDLPDTVRETTELPTLAADLSSECSAIPTDASSNHASFSSTPPTVLTDAASVASESNKPDLNTITATLASLDQSDPAEIIEQTVEVGTPHRDLPIIATPKRTRVARATTRTPVYNLAKLTGTYIHGKRRANGDDVRPKRPRATSAVETTPADTKIDQSVSASPKGARGGAKVWSAKDKGKAPAIATRRSTRSSAAASENVVDIPPTSGKRGQNAPRELRRLRDTNEFVFFEAKPVLHTVWSNGKFIPTNELDDSGQPLHKKTRKNAARKHELVEEEEQEEEQEEATPALQGPNKRVKKWLSTGLYAGQEAPADYTAGLSAADKKKLAQLPELKPSGKVNSVLPLPMFAGLRTLVNGRHFKLPYDVCNPLPPGQPKPDEWRKMTKNRFVGDAGTYWRKTDHFKDYQSKCVCKPDDGCAEDCQNRIMLYECDDTNCNVGKEHCQNRAFQNLTERTKKGGRFRVGVEVLKTSDRGHGVRSNRCFEPNQIIMEYTGEIITEAECERRMNEIYKDNECYYLMAFDQNMIIDATTGSIARFVNHSCEPNCRMEKWIVHGQPRMALFAGEKPIMTGDELTYDYNFDPFSAKNVQKCLCGSAKCRGVLGPKVPKVAKGELKTIKAAVKVATKAGKRKLQTILGGVEDGNPGKKRKLAKASLKKTNTISVKTAAAAKPKVPTPSISVRKATLVKSDKVFYTKNGKKLMLADTIVSKASTIVSTPKPASKKKAASKALPVKGKAKVTIKKTTNKGTIKSTIKSAGVKGSARGTGKSAKHTVSKTVSKKATKMTVKTVKTTRVAKESILASPVDSVPAPAEGGSISVKGPQKVLDLSQSQGVMEVERGSD